MSALLRSPAFLTSLAIGALMIAAILEARAFSPPARFVPVLFAWITLGLVALDLVRQALPVLRAARAAAAEDRGARADAAPAESATRVILYVLAFWILVLLFGFFGMPALLIWAYLTVEARVRWFVALGAALIGNGAILWGMAGLGVSIWHGAAPQIVPGIVGGESWPIF